MIAEAMTMNNDYTNRKIMGQNHTMKQLCDKMVPRCLTLDADPNHLKKSLLVAKLVIFGTIQRQNDSQWIGKHSHQE